MKHNLLFVILSLAFYFSHGQIRSQAPWQQQVSYHIEVELDDVAHQLQANLSLKYTNNSNDTLEAIYFHLWPNAYKNTNTAFAKQQLENGDLEFQYSTEEDKGFIDELNFISSGKVLQWAYDKKYIDVAKVTLAMPLAPGKTVVIETPFVVKIPKVFSRLGHDDQDYYITQWYPKPAVYDVNGWNVMPYLNQGEFYSEFGDFTVSISLADNYVVAATGELQTASEIAFNSKRIDYPLKLAGDSVLPSSKTKKTIVYKADNVHDFAWFASKNFNIKESTVEINKKKITTRVVAYDPLEIHLIHIATALNYYSENVGMYPYSHATVVNGELKAGGGMEYPMITLCDVMSEEVIVHEVGHNWFYGILGNNERSYPWMDESINSFYDSRATAADGASSKTNDLTSNVMNYLVKDNVLRNEHQAIAGHSADFTSINYGVSVYGIGSNAFSHLHAYLGDAKFKKAMQAYYEEWKFRHPLPDDMKVSFEKTLSEDFSWFFNDLLESNKVLDYKLKKKGTKVLLKNKGSVKAPMPVEFQNGEQKKTLWAVAAPGQTVELVPPFASYTSITIDPNRNTLDLFPDNDKWKKSIAIKPFIGADQKGVKEIYALPALGWNYYDKWMLGAAIHNYAFSNKALQYHVVPLYSFDSKQLNGLAKVSYTKSQKGLGAYTEYALEGQRFSWSQLGYNEFSYHKVNPKITFHLAKSRLRSPISKEVSISYDYIGFNPNFDLDQDRQDSRNTNYTSLAPWQFISAAYQIEKKGKMSGYKFWVEIEHGITTQDIYESIDTFNIVGSDTVRTLQLINTDVKSSNHTKLTAVLDMKVDIGIKKKPLEIRTFVSYFLEAPEDGYFNHSITYTGERAFVADYRFQELSMNRNGREGMLRNQVATKGHMSRFVGILGQSDKLLANVVVTVPLPGKIPLRPYAEFLSYTDIKKGFWNEAEASMIYNIGFEFRVIPDIFSIYFNVAQPKDVTSAQENRGIDTFMERVTFSLNLRDFTPPKIKSGLSFF